MDLTSTHTTAAETMAPETTAAETKSSKKPEETTKAADVSASVSGSTKIETYHPKDFPAGSIAYPVVAHMKDETKQNQVNDLLYQNAISICDARLFPWTPAASPLYTRVNTTSNKGLIQYRPSTPIQ